MEIINIIATDVSPEIILDLDNNIFTIRGKSVVTEVDSFYAPVLNWLERAEGGLNKPIDFVFDLEYFNIFSSKRILFILYKLADIDKAGANINVIWNFTMEDGNVSIAVKASTSR